MSGAATQTASKGHWSRDCVEHLRTVHFTLVSVCLALLVLSTSWTSNLLLAEKQLRDIIELYRSWNPNWALLPVRKTLAFTEFPYKVFPPQKSLGIQFQDGGSRKFLEIEFQGDNWTINDKDDHLARGWSTGRLPNEIVQRADVIPITGSYDKLRSFHEFWNLLARDDLLIKVPLTIGRTEAVVNTLEGVTQRKFRVPIVLVTTGNVDASLQMRLFAPGGAIFLDDSLKHGYYSGKYIDRSKVLPNGESKEYVISIPVTKYSSFGAALADLQGVFVSRFGTWKHGTYEYSFRELHDITKNYEDLNLETTLTIIESEKARAGESFEAFGIKFPGQGTTRWGMLIVVSIQIYFWLHFQQLAKKLRPNDEGWDVAWIGVYHSFAARIVFGISALLVPVLTVVNLEMRAAELGALLWWKHVALAMPILISTLVAFLTWKLQPVRITRVV